MYKQAPLSLPIITEAEGGTADKPISQATG
jgi:hypothetical protein